MYLGKNNDREMVSTFCSMSLDPGQNYLLVSGYQKDNFERSAVQVLSLEKHKFCKIMASFKLERYYEFTKGQNWVN
jgi:hypothetical protein